MLAPSTNSVEFAKGGEHGYDVLQRSSGLRIMDAIEDKTSASGEDRTAPQNLLPDFGRSSERQRLLRINASTPENDSVSEGILQCLGIHSGGRTLYGIEDIESGLDQ